MKENKFFGHCLKNIYTDWFFKYRKEHRIFLLSWMISAVIVTNHVYSSKEHVEKWRSPVSSEMSALL